MNFLKIGLLLGITFLMTSCGGGAKQTDTDIPVVDSIVKAMPIETKTDSTTMIQQPDWAKNAVIYEVNTRQFSEEGTFNKVTEQLHRIKDLGADIVWLMPIYPIGQKNRKGSLGSYYAVKDYKAVNPEFGTKEEFKQLVDSAHSLGMKVILDWVANHSSPDNVWVKDHLDYYTKDSLGNAPIPTIGTDWDDVADLNYDNPEMRAAMTDAMQYWLKEFDIDGYRCDVAGMVPIDFWIENRKALEQIKPVFMLAEGAETDLYKAFNMTYGWPFKDLLISIGKGEKDFSAIEKYFNQVKKDYTPNDIIMYFTTNHDENSWNYLEKDAFGVNLKNYITLTYAMGGMPLIYDGQESGLDKQLEFFEKDPIVWGDYKYTQLYQQLNALLKNNKALWSDGERAKMEVVKADKETFQFIRSKNGETMAFLQNYSDKEQVVPQISLNGFDISKNLINGEAIPEDSRGVIVVPPHETVVVGAKK